MDDFTGMRIQWMNMHFRDNGLDPDHHQLIQAAVANKNGRVWFLTGLPDRYWGQSILSNRRLFKYWLLKHLRACIRNKDGSLKKKVKVESPKAWEPIPNVILENTTSITVKAVSLNYLLHPLDKVDLIHLDVQGTEFLVLNAAAQELNRKVKVIHIGTHNHKNESGLRKLFSGLGWRNIHDFPSNTSNITRWGTINFQDGVQTWINSKFSAKYHA